MKLYYIMFNMHSKNSRNNNNYFLMEKKPSQLIKSMWNKAIGAIVSKYMRKIENKKYI